MKRMFALFIVVLLLLSPWGAWGVTTFANVFVPGSAFRPARDGNGTINPNACVPLEKWVAWDDPSLATSGYATDFAQFLLRGVSCPRNFSGSPPVAYPGFTFQIRKPAGVAGVSLVTLSMMWDGTGSFTTGTSYGAVLTVAFFDNLPGVTTFNQATVNAANIDMHTTDVGLPNYNGEFVTRPITAINTLVHCVNDPSVGRGVANPAIDTTCSGSGFNSSAVSLDTDMSIVVMRSAIFPTNPPQFSERLFFTGATVTLANP